MKQLPGQPLKHEYAWGDFTLMFTKDIQLLREYYKVRQSCYRQVPGGPRAFSGAEDQYDRSSDILVAVNKGTVVGGARIVGSTPSRRIVLPMEDENLLLKNMFPDFRLDSKSYCEYGRLAVLQEYRSLDLLRHMCAALTARAIERGYAYLFSKAPYVQILCYQKISRLLQMPRPYIIHKHINLPDKGRQETGNLKMYLASIELPNRVESEKISHLLYFDNPQYIKAA